MVKPPCSVEELVSAFRVRDANGRSVAFVYFAEGSYSLLPRVISLHE